MTILTSENDNFLYFRLIDLLKEIKLVQGGSAIAPTLRRHKTIKEYLITKQVNSLSSLEDKFFDLKNNSLKNIPDKNGFM